HFFDFLTITIFRNVKISILGIDSRRPAARPAGRPWRSKTPVLSFCRTLSRLLIRSNDTKENALNVS
ncbi:hypothetical protein ABRP77_18290, partial [Pectobacterium odoriferum]|uniref:hypothetical protein n=1 Tax=Pectobacterium odoriferum TaxID=78398 RepID=UPI0032F03D1B